MESNVSNELDLRSQNADVQPAPGVAQDEYENKEIGAELTKADINRMAWRSLLLQASFNYERMQASGWLYGLLPALKKIHTNK
ncbi:PTS system mannose/fructose/sorbose family transporter subunit IID, partial [Vibrio anguillarum]